MNKRYSNLRKSVDDASMYTGRQREVVYHPNQFALPSRYLNNNDLTKEELAEVATIMNNQAEQYRELAFPERWIKPDTGIQDASHEDFFRGQRKTTIRKWRTDSIEAMYMSDTNFRYAIGGRDIEKSQNHIRIYDYKENELKQLYSNTNNGNFVCVDVCVFYMRLLVDNGVEFV